MQNKQNRDTSWQKSAQWYNKIVGDKGHYYHQHTIFPNLIRLLAVGSGDGVLDIGCGQGVLGRQLPKDVRYVGIDAAKDLISFAIKQHHPANHEFFLADATKPLSINKKDFTHAVALLSLQNMEFPDKAIYQVAQHLKKDGKFVIVLNHPAFRIPRQSGWDTSENKQQYRYVNRYLSPMKIPITMHPGQQSSALTWSFHFPISSYVQFLQKAGFAVETMEEWASDKESVGKTAKMENRARAEIPLFLAIVARKN